MKNKTPDPRFADWDIELPKTHNRVTSFELKKDAELPHAKTGTKATDTSNPYLRARVDVLKNYKEWRRNEVLEMERLGNIDNAHYDVFVKEVAELGDKYMPICE